MRADRQAEPGALQMTVERCSDYNAAFCFLIYPAFTVRNVPNVYAGNTRLPRYFGLSCALLQ